MSKPLPPGYKGWIVTCLVIFVGALVLLAADVTAGFVYFDQKTTPLWVTVLGVAAVLGIALGFVGFLLIMVVAGYKNWKESQKIQVIPPARPAHEQ